MKSADIREQFLKYFESQGHLRLPSSSLIPAEDPTLLFTNAGMVQFKDYFLGLKTPKGKRATTSQKCVRAGGKHNDLENVGFTPRHHTFFEMLGNFSFGDYFKKEAIHFAWTLLTKEFRIPTQKLWVTVFETDDEAIELWKKEGVSQDRIYRLGEKDNFWAMGETGPCGPCTEIHYDWGEAFGKNSTPANDPKGRFFEIWNLVFMQFNRDSSGKLTPLPKPSVDTGAGLERLACVLQGVFSNYDTDLFRPLIAAASAKTKVSYGQSDEKDVSLRVIADHLRSSCFLIADGILPSNEGRGYVLRRILRRAIRHGKKLGQNNPFLFELSNTLVENLGTIYPELKRNEKQIREILKEEEVRFHETLHRGMGLLEESIEKAKKQKKKVLPGNIAFKLYDTFGFPVDLTATITAEHGLTVDEKGFEEGMEKQRSQSVWTGSKTGAVTESLGQALTKIKKKTQFLGYKSLSASSKIVAVCDGSGQECKSLKKSNTGFLVFEKTPFYAESGGQVGDHGTLEWKSGQAKVKSVFKLGGLFVHEVEVEKGEIKKGITLKLEVNPELRRRTAINHTATHLLHAALRQVLGERVRQAGSLVDADRLRFDFTYPRSLSEAEIETIEKMVNEEILKNDKVSHQEMAYSQALKSGALAFFDEKYGDRVRVIRVGGTKEPFSVELCGGTHLHQTADIGLLKVTSETSIASGTRRIEAITSNRAVDYLLQRNKLLEQVQTKFSTQENQLLTKIDSVLQETKKLQSENEKLQVIAAQVNIGNSQKGSLWDKSVQYRDLKVVMEQVPQVNPKVLRTLVDQVRDKLKEKTIVVLASHSEGKVFLCVGLSKDLVGAYDANHLIKPMAEKLGGSGGGRPDFAQAGGSNPEAINEAFESFKSWLQAQT